jgi:hypothetical protein
MMHSMRVSRSSDESICSYSCLKGTCCRMCRDSDGKRLSQRNLVELGHGLLATVFTHLPLHLNFVPRWLFLNMRYIYK